MSEEKKDPRMAELDSMKAVVEALAGLDDEESIARVLRWAADSYKVALGPSKGARMAASGGESGRFESANGSNGATMAEASDLADLYHRTNPESEADKVLVAAYWTQFGQGNSDFGAQEINSALKNLGHPIKNITTAFDTLKARKPASVIQLKKSGTSKQARKTYRVTVAGKTAVEAMIGPSE